MCASSARRRVVAPRLGALIVAVVAVVAPLLAACSSSQEPVATATPSPTPMARLETRALELPRIEFCSLVPEDAVADALGTRGSGAGSGSGSVEGTAWGNGDALALPGTGRDRVQELGCSWTTGTTTARAWLLARPVDQSLARELRREAAGRDGCRVVDAPFGASAFEQTCGPQDAPRRTRYAGLFDQTWLTCEVAGGVSTGGRAEQWCVAVASSLAAAR